jgi:hypothetical protein
MPLFKVLCRIDAFADYVAEVEADNAEDAAELARESHEDYSWETDGTQEFDDRIYVTLNAHGEAMEHTKVGDF